jgi:hypothetical protein
MFFVVDNNIVKSREITIAGEMQIFMLSKRNY